MLLDYIFAFTLLNLQEQLIEVPQEPEEFVEIFCDKPGY